MRPQSTTAPEIWLPVVGYEGLYEVSDLGRVRRLKAYNSTYPGRLLRPGSQPNGYFCVGLSREGRRTGRTVHRLVAEAFLGPCPTGHEVNHRNGIKPDNRAVNLEWVTCSQNTRHAVATGLQSGLKGEASPHAKLTDGDVQIIRSRRGTTTLRRLAQEFGVSHGTISDIQTGRTWKQG